MFRSFWSRSSGNRLPSIPSREGTPVAVQPVENRQSTLPFTTEIPSQVTSSQPVQIQVQVANSQLVKEEHPIINGNIVTDNTIASWLASLELSAYIDNFHQQNLFNMSQLDEFTIDDLQKMKIGTSHRNKIWKALIEFRNAAVVAITNSQNGLQRDTSATSTMSLGSQNSISQSSAYCPGYYEVTRYTFKHTISYTSEKDALQISPKSRKVD